MIYVEFTTEEPEGEFHKFLVGLMADGESISTIQKDGAYVNADEYAALKMDATFANLVVQELESFPGWSVPLYGKDRR